MPKAASAGSGELVVVRDLLSAVAPHHWVESHPHSYSSTPSPSSSSSAATAVARFGARSSRRIRSWIIHDKNKDKDRHGQGHSESVRFRLVPGEASDAGENEDIVLVAVATAANKDDVWVHAHATPNQLDQTPTQANATMHTLANTNANLNPAELEPEEAAVDMLIGLMGEGFDRAVVRRILTKYDGNVEKAAGALVEGERGEEIELPMIGPSLPGPGAGPAVVGPSASSWHFGGPGLGSGSQTQTEAQTGQSQSSALGGRPNTPVIDLTLDDDPDLQRAMQESMSTLHAQSVGSYAPSYASTARAGYSTLAGAYAPVQTQREGQMSNTMMLAQQQVEGPVFGPSERPPDPNWAVVPSHVRHFNLDVWTSLTCTCSAKRQQRCELFAELESRHRSELGDDGGLGCARAIPGRAAVAEGWMVSATRRFVSSFC